LLPLSLFSRTRFRPRSQEATSNNSNSIMQCYIQVIRTRMPREQYPTNYHHAEPLAYLLPQQLPLLPFTPFTPFASVPSAVFSLSPFNVRFLNASLALRDLMSALEGTSRPGLRWLSAVDRPGKLTFNSRRRSWRA